MRLLFQKKRSLKKMKVKNCEKTNQFSSKASRTNYTNQNIEQIRDRTMLVLKLYDKINSDTLGLDSHYIKDCGLHHIDSLHLVEIVAGQTNCSVYSRSQRLVFVEKFNFSQSEEKKTCDRLRAVQTQYTDATKLCFKNQSKQKLPKKVQVLRRKIS